MKRFEDLLKRLDECHCADSGCDCSEVMEHLFELVDEHMPSHQAQRLLEHSAGCEHCADMIRAEVNVRVVLRKSCCGDVASEDLRARIIRVIER
ncbi:mycothiol system anti-sigma-R factor [Arcanobacterium haemolyticum]|uniref:Anti-sigma factor n=1 Tax=Arcanobacterium haemolyticum (strain ATCC 9345 / DSM 20595 / CCM 5947 / CCUG 17215 / LMG 16163 / NBRC 15585 / NCTC 8452 / 11018) TaxID=644284 RepID=D7BME3_ARCHD|nr:anti-sigma factor [Arcanobacterium haemolyticum]ADH92092.1 anti-sigma factor [Arcanobacterium haemolyticum DSM 20595]QCX46261.1 mycothiol system anti-sigma-R factor [Arcanobacterium haemolyticum]SPT74979.1 anti-sigma factor [Arcanobacterium haemolyticum]SQH29203.1 anti-sigma factor [Arcanobacterium haemolyticum]